MASPWPQSPHQQHVKHAHGADRKYKSDGDRVPDVDARVLKLDYTAVGRQLRVWRGRTIEVLGVEDDRRHDDAGRDPGHRGGHGGHRRCPVGSRADREPDRGEAVGAHEREHERAGKHVDAGQNVEDAADDGAEHPLTQQRRRHYHRHSDEEQRVGDGQVKDVNVGDSLHTSVARHDVDDESIADQTDRQYSAVSNDQGQQWPGSAIITSQQWPRSAMTRVSND